MKFKLFFFILAMINLTAHAADDSAALQAHLETSFSNVIAAVDATTASLATQSNMNSTPTVWQTELKVFHLNVSPYATFGVKGFADVTVAPEIEFIFQKNED